MDSTQERHWHDVWACSHLWLEVDAGVDSAEAAHRIEDAASAFLSDCGENVALCDDCEQTAEHGVVVPLVLRHIQWDWRDGNTPQVVASRPGRVRSG